jgi:hypothetical protein
LHTRVSFCNAENKVRYSLAPEMRATRPRIPLANFFAIKIAFLSDTNRRLTVILADNIWVAGWHVS